jgi:alpha-1,2-mannosyltransferase
MRLGHSFGVAPWWIATAAIIGVVGITVAVIASRRGDEATGFSICAITGLLVSPISWTHHWALAVPAVFLLAVAAYRRRSTPGLIAAAGAALIGYSYSTWFINKSDPLGLNLAAGGLLAADPYVLIGLAALGLTCLAQYRILRARSASVVSR